MIGLPKRIYLPLATREELEELRDNPTYRPWIVARYPHWTIYLHDADQGLPGRMRVWLRRHVDLMSAEELLPGELLEFQYQILPAIGQSIRSLWPSYIRLNHEWLGNEVQHHRGHGHYHVTPRFEGSFTIGKRTFTDEDCTARRRTPKLKLPINESKHILRLLRATEPFERLRP